MVVCLQALVDIPCTNLRREPATPFFSTLCARLCVDHGDLRASFKSLLTAIFKQHLGFWICDYVAIICADSAVTSSDPEEFYVLQPQGVLDWCDSTANDLRHQVLALLRSGAAASQPDQIIELGNATQSLLSVAQAVQAALGPNSRAAQDATDTLQLLHQTTQVLQWLEQQQQQRPGQPPLITRSSPLNHSGSASSGDSHSQSQLIPAIPAHSILAAWQQTIANKRQQSSNNRLFLDDLVNQLLVVPSGQRAWQYPFPDVLSCVEGLFMTGSGSKEAWQQKLAVLLYYLLDGGWLSSATSFAQGFQLPLTLVQQWQCHYLLDAAAAGDSEGALNEACRLLEATAGPSTPFRFVEALLTSGRPTTALAVQRARAAAAGGGSGSTQPLSLPEANVLLQVQLECGLLAEAFSEMRRHCQQVLIPQRASHVKALMQQLAKWAVDDNDDDDDHRQRQQQQQGQSISRLQQVCQLPFDVYEEAALLQWLTDRAGTDKSGGHMVPLYLLQRGRTLEALTAYAEYRSSPAAQGGSSSSSGSVGLLKRQLHTLMSATAASVPPNLRAHVAVAGSVTAAAAAHANGSGLRHIQQGIGGLGLHSSLNPYTSVAALICKGVQPPLFSSPIVMAEPAGGLGYNDAVGIRNTEAVALAAAAMASTANTAAAARQSTDAVLDRTNPLFSPHKEPAVPASRHVNKFSTPGPCSQFTASLFGQQVAEAAGPGSVDLRPPQEGVAGTLKQGITNDQSRVQEGAGGPEFVPLLFGTPAPANRSGPGFSSTTAGRIVAEAGFKGIGAETPGTAETPGLFSMTEDEFGREILGLGDYGTTPGSGQQNAERRSSKRQRQTPVRYKPGGK